VSFASAFVVGPVGVVRRRRQLLEKGQEARQITLVERSEGLVGPLVELERVPPVLDPGAVS
jgi:hypothetical protein